MESNVLYGVDGDMITACREDFINGAESPMGFGYSQEEALADLISQEILPNG